MRARVAVLLLALASVFAGCGGMPAPAAVVALYDGPDISIGDLLQEKTTFGERLRCVDREPARSLGGVVGATWAPDSINLALTRVITSESRRTVTGYEEDPLVQVLNTDTGKLTDFGPGSRPQWSGSGAFLSYWRDGDIHVIFNGRRIARITVSLAETRWVGDQLLYWYRNEIRVRDFPIGTTNTMSAVDPGFMPRYPQDDAYFSADGQSFTLTRYSMNGAADRYVGSTRTGQMAPLDFPGATYTEWAPVGGTLLVRSNERLELRGPQGWKRGASLADFAGTVHGWSPDGTLMVGSVTSTVPGGTKFDRFAVWDGDGVVTNATIPNLIGSRVFSPDGRWFAGVDRMSLGGTELALYRCGTALRGVTAPQPDPTAPARLQKIEAASERFVRPVAGFVSQFLQGAHTGVDIAAPVGALITAADAGTVNFVGWAPVGGRAVCVLSPGGLESCMYHTSLALVTVGQHVDRGQPIAAIGMTGATSGPHVHWEVKLNGRVVNPLAH